MQETKLMGKSKLRDTYEKFLFTVPDFFFVQSAKTTKTEK